MGGIVAKGATYPVEYAFGVAENLVIPEPDDGVALRFKPCRSVGVVFGAGRVLSAIDFHDKLPFQAGEIGDIWPERHLAPEPRAVDLPPPQPRP